MKSRLVLGLLAAVSVLGCGGGEKKPEPTVPAFDSFVADKSHYAWAEKWSTHTGGANTTTLSVTSQHWRSEAEVDRVEWKHSVALSYFDGAPSKTALVVLLGGKNDADVQPGDSNIKTLENLALAVGTPVVFVSGVPSNALSFIDGGTNLSEDDLVAPTWDRVLLTGDPTWSAYFPMARAAIRSMDAAQEFMAQQDHPIDRFVVTGYSKRGATTYLVAAADKRVVAMAPGVFDFLDFRAQAAHHLAVYGAPAAAVKPYAQLNLLERFATPEADVLLATSDPFAYRDRFTMPKLLLASPGDQFFLPDSMQFYRSSLPGETLVRYVANTDHSLADVDGKSVDGLSTLTGWYRAIATGKKRPALAWAVTGDALKLTSDLPVESAVLWRATNATARDFRRDTIGPTYESTPLTVGDDNSVQATLEKPSAGYACAFIEVTVGGTKYSTEALVISAQR